MKITFVEDAGNFYKWWVVHGLTLIGLFQAFLLALPESVSSKLIWEVSIADWGHIITALMALGTGFVRTLQQPALQTNDNAD